MDTKRNVLTLETMIRVYKRKLILTKSQSARISSWIGACRVVYNLGLEIKNATYKATGKSISSYDLMKQLPELKQEYDWIKDVPGQTLQASLIRLETSYQNFFRTFKQGGGYPKFASKKKFKSITFIQHRKILRVTLDKINVPKLGELKMFKDSEIRGDIKTATIKIEPTGFFICIQCENVPSKFVSESQAIGLDMGLSHFCIDSNGNFIANPRHFKNYERQLRIENRSLARKKKGSNSWVKQCKKLARLHHTIGNVRRDFLHKESTKIAKVNSVVYMEDLNIKGMSKNGNLAKHILDAGWGEFGTMIAYKTQRVGVNPKGTSQECSECGNVDAENRKSQSVFLCTKCSHTENADVNAGKVILGRGMALDRQREALACS